jgi:hypothetical protein
MGTSINQSSPATSNWNAVWTCYDRDEVPVERIAQEVWRAATNQPKGNLGTDLGSPIVAECFRQATTAQSASAAQAAVRRQIIETGSNSLAAEIAQRALVRSFASPLAKTDAFVSLLFSEASNYLVARDLPGHVGRSNRTASVSSARALKRGICDLVATRAKTAAGAFTKGMSNAQWRSEVVSLLTKLSGS